MIKTIGLVGILCAAAILGMTWARQNVQTTEKAPAAILQAAATVLELNHRTTGTYGATKLETVTLAWADQSRYCIEFGGQHIAGPGGTPTSGACPR
jgi:hypothetical protein